MAAQSQRLITSFFLNSPTGVVTVTQGQDESMDTPAAADSNTMEAAAATPDLREELSPSPSHSSHPSESPVPEQSAVSHRDPANGPGTASFPEGPFQPHMEFPMTVQGDKARSFHANWYQRFPWLEYSPKLDAAFCFCCRLYDSSHVDSPFVKNGMKNWKKALGKKGKFNCHAQSSTHQTCWVKWTEAKSQPCSIADQLDNVHRDQVEKNREYMKCIIETIMYLAQHNIAFRGHDESVDSINRGNFLDLVSLRAKDNIILKEYLAKKNHPYTSPTFQNQLIDIIGNSVRGKIVERCTASKFFSIIVDETSDISNVEQVSVVIRFVLVERGEVLVEEHFLGFWCAHTTTGEALFELLKEVLRSVGLSFSNLRAQCYDGASNMRGRYSGLCTRVQEIEPRALYVHCYAHILNLVLGDACQSITKIRDTFGVIATIYNFIEASPKRHHIFTTIMKESSDKCITLKRLCETRWHCRYECVRSIRICYKPLCEALKQISKTEANQSGANAAMILKNISTFEFILNVTVLESVLSLTNLLSKQFQERGADISALHSKVQAVVDSLKVKRSERYFKNVWDGVMIVAQEMNIEPPSLPRPRKVPKRIDDGSPSVVFSSPCDNLRVTVFYPLLDCLVEEINDRFKENDIHWLSLLYECLLEWNETLPEHIAEIEEFYKISNLQAEFQGFHAFARSNIDSLSIKTFHDLANEFIKRDLVEMFPGVWDLLRIALCIPVSSASPERSFSALRRLKTYLRNTMGQGRLSNLAIIHLEQELSSKIDCKDIIDIFASTNRRMDL